MKGLKIAGWLFQSVGLIWATATWLLWRAALFLTTIRCQVLASCCRIYFFKPPIGNIQTRQSEISHTFSNRFSLCWRNCRQKTTSDQLVLAPTRALLHYPFESNSRYSPKLTSYAAQFHCFYIFRSYSLLRKPWPSLGRHWWLNAVNFGQFSSPMNRTCLNLVKHWQSFYLL